MMISHSGIKPDIRIYTYLLQGFASCGDLQSCRTLLDRCVYMGLQPDVVFWTILLDAYIQAGDFVGATEVHRDWFVPSRCLPDIRYQNTLLNLHAKCGDLNSIVRVYEEILAGTLVSAAARTNTVSQKKNHKPKWGPDEQTYTILIDSFMRAGNTRMAIYFLDVMQCRRTYELQMVQSPELTHAEPNDTNQTHDQRERQQHYFHEPIQPTAPTYTAIISGYAHRKDVGEALRWFRLLFEVFPETASRPVPTTFAGCGPNLKTWTAVLHAYAKAGDMDAAEEWIRQMSENSGEELDGRAYNTLIGCYAGVREYGKAAKVLEDMKQSNVESDAITFGMLIDSHLKRTWQHPDGNIPAALETYNEMTTAPRNIKPTLHILTSLISRLGHVAGKVDAFGRPVISRSGGGLPSHLRVGLPPATPPPILAGDTSLFPTEKRIKGLYDDALRKLYRTYRLNLPILLSPSRNHHRRSSSANAGTLVPAPLPVYDALIAHRATLHHAQEIQAVYLHAIVDGCIPDESMHVRAVQGLLRSRGGVRWRHAVHFWAHVKTVTRELRMERARREEIREKKKILRVRCRNAKARSRDADSRSGD
ncbi:hypothetical protein BC830DRAFT_929156 [Chytriomyces sp. MP71]|nr:hypothetical protein BC830DRAFT_929156 [Chytriomyces sp. MP71]